LGKGDTVESRAAILLNYELRQENASFDLSSDQLAKACGLKKAVFEDLQRKISNYLTPYSAAAPAATQQRQRQAKAYQNQGSSDVSTSSSPQHHEISSIIPTISIRLGPLVSDSLGFAQRAQQLLLDMKHHVSRNRNQHERQGYLQDIQRNYNIYEAACFYLVAEEDSTAEDHILPALLEAARVNHHVFRDIYTTAKKFWDEIKAIETACYKKPAAVASKAANATISKRKRAGTETADLDSNEKKEAPKQFVYTDSYLEWKARVLAEAIDKVRSESQENDISDARAIELAAKAILVKNGIL
jgi:hypothetical protein